MAAYISRLVHGLGKPWYEGNILHLVFKHGLRAERNVLVMLILVAHRILLRDVSMDQEVTQDVQS